jgi:hypothetical protein
MAWHETPTSLGTYFPCCRPTTDYCNVVIADNYNNFMTLGCILGVYRNPLLIIPTSCATCSFDTSHPRPFCFVAHDLNICATWTVIDALVGGGSTPVAWLGASPEKAEGAVGTL